MQQHECCKITTQSKLSTSNIKDNNQKERKGSRLVLLHLDTNKQGMLKLLHYGYCELYIKNMPSIFQCI
jgi:hypothetical protein